MAHLGTACVLSGFWEDQWATQQICALTHAYGYWRSEVTVRSPRDRSQCSHASIKLRMGVYGILCGKTNAMSRNEQKEEPACPEYS
jgi:hypothetical protein